VIQPQRANGGGRSSKSQKWSYSGKNKTQKVLTTQNQKLSKGKNSKSKVNYTLRGLAEEALVRSNWILSGGKNLEDWRKPENIRKKSA